MSHLEKNGFKVEKKIVFGKGFTDLKRKHGVPEKLFACHTALSKATLSKAMCQRI